MYYWSPDPGAPAVHEMPPLTRAAMRKAEEVKFRLFRAGILTLLAASLYRLL
ncbi:MAG: hypothetical protein UY99_C0016G0003 [Parcubacteria group bacterium GW2011_GWA1_59_11]|nr:MAG: hypothetical protein UY99_C0016G0003 [Parcubacteria group bacterium GW2011_GWA1_59_11]